MTNVRESHGQGLKVAHMLSGHTSLTISSSWLYLMSGKSSKWISQWITEGNTTGFIDKTSVSLAGYYKFVYL
jgi:hypothetical protein